MRIELARFSSLASSSALVALLAGLPGCGSDSPPPSPQAGAGGFGAAGRSGGGGQASGGMAGAGQGGGAGFATGGSGDAGHAGEDGAAGAGEAGAAQGGDAGVGGEGGVAGAGRSGAGGASGHAGTAGHGGGGACTGGPEHGCPCIKVSAAGDDVEAASDLGSLPFRTIRAALAFADEHRDVAVDVCVAGGEDCRFDASYAETLEGDLRLPSGISLYGSYEPGTWARCETITTVLELGSPAGVLFGPDVVARTRLDGVVLTLAAIDGARGVSVDGSTEVELADVFVDAGERSSGFTGVHITSGARVTLRGVTIEGRSYAGGAVGVHSVAGRVALIDSEVRVESATLPLIAVMLDSSPGSEVDGSSVTASGFGVSAADEWSAVNALRISGDASGVGVHDSSILASGPAGHTVAAEFVACAGAEPRLFDNPSIVAEMRDGSGGTLPIAAVRSSGDCHPRVEANEIIAVRGLGLTAGAGIHCIAAGVPSRCVIVDNDDIHAGEALTAHGSTGTGIWCQGGSCSEIRRNAVRGLTERSSSCATSCAHESFGIRLEAGSAPLVDANHVGAGAGAGAGIYVSDSYARIQNNLVVGRTGSDVYGLGAYLPVSYGVWVEAGGADVHSNVLAGGGSVLPGISSCISAGARGYATYRNNVFYPGGCNEHYGLVSAGNLEHNAFAVSSGTALLAHFDYGGTYVYDLEQLNAMGSSTGNIRASCDVGSLTCVDKGTSLGAPEFDLDGNPRGAAPDIGPREFGDWCPEESCSGHGECFEPVAAPRECVCDSGYVRPDDAPLSCAVDYCYLNGGCDWLVSCTRTASGRVCGPCPDGYTGHGETGCVEVDDCLADNGGCDPLTQCTDTLEGAICGPCPSGYAGTGETGCDLDECVVDNGGCDPLTTCVNTSGGRTCGACPPGHGGSGETGCTAPACSSEPCQGGAACFGLEGGGYACDCAPGLTGNCDVPFRKLSFGGSFCGLRDDGRIECWGDDRYGQATPPPGTFTELAGGGGDMADGGVRHCAIATDGTVACWGLNTSGAASPPVGTFVALSSNGACGILSDGGVDCWGATSLASVTPPSGTYSFVEASATTACAIAQQDGALHCWGSPIGSGPPGGGGWSSVSLSATSACGIQGGVMQCWGSTWALPGTFIQVLASACALRTDQTLVCWGSTPPEGTFRELWVAGSYRCAQRTDGTLACWGRYGGNFEPPAGAVDVVAISPGGGCARRESGEIACWGGEPRAPGGVFQDIEGSCWLDYAGHLECDFGALPVEGTFAKPAQGSCAIRVDRTLECWGSGTSQPPAGTFVDVVSDSNGDGCGIRSDGSVACWAQSESAAARPPPGAFTRLGMAAASFCGIRTDGTLACWGDGELGTLVPPSGTFQELSTWWFSACALRTDGTVTCWGTGSDALSDEPLGTFVDLTVGDSFACALRPDQTVQCWGGPSFVVTEAPAGAFEKITSYGAEACGLRPDRTLQCWGWQVL